MNELLLKTYVKAQVARVRLINKLHSDERGAGAAEYAMIIGVAVVLGIVILRNFWGETPTTGLRGVFNNILGRLETATTGSVDGGALKQ